jgi:hypothetical protein
MTAMQEPKNNIWRMLKKCTPFPCIGAENPQMSDGTEPLPLRAREGIKGEGICGLFAASNVFIPIVATL